MFFVKALTRLNEQLTKNSQVREELHTLYIERVRFQQLHNRLSKVRGHITFNMIWRQIFLLFGIYLLGFHYI